MSGYIILLMFCCGYLSLFIIYECVCVRVNILYIVCVYVCVYVYIVLPTPYTSWIGLKITFLSRV